jgi:NTE family protein
MNTKRIGVGFSGGGARGSAHIGALRALLNREIVPEVVAGTSAGSIVGALYAAGKSPDEMMTFIRRSKLFKLVSFGLPSGGFTKLDYLKDRFAESGLPETFEELERPLYITMTNLNTGQLEVRSSGPLYDVIVASCSIPLVFEPVEIDGQMFVDGGVLCNLPITPLRAACDFVIGINIIPLQEMASKEVSSFAGVAQRYFDLAIISNTRPEAQNCDFYLEMERMSSFGIYEFHRYKEMHEVGYQEMASRMKVLRGMLEE